MTLNTKQKGNRGEEQAVEFLLGNGYKILARNFKTKIGELDIIAQDKSRVVFVEVKMRSGFSFGDAAEAINRKKKKRIVQTALFYIKQNHLEKRDFRFDLVTVVDGTITHDKNIFFVEGCTV